MLAGRGLSKRFGATVALERVDFELRAGEVRALIGANGAGKSTLLSLVAGAQRPDAGTLALDGRPYAPRDPADARARGVAMVHQELSLAPDLTVAENVVLGLESSRFGLVSGRERDARARRALAQLGRGDLDLAARTGDLSLATQQGIEIARALACEARVLVLDEPASALAHDDARRLFELVRELARSGLAIAYVSHFLDEVRRVADTFTVLRNGSVVDEGRIEDASDARLVTNLAGRAFEVAERERSHSRGEPVLVVESFASERSRATIDLTVHAGEVVGLAGQLGAGRTTLLRGLFGLDRRASGVARVLTTAWGNDAAERAIASAPRSAESAVGGPSSRRENGFASASLRSEDDVGSATRRRELGGAGATRRTELAAIAASPAASLARGVGFVPEDRKREGLALDLSVEENATLGALARFARAGVIDRRARRSAATAALERLRCRFHAPTQAARELSGGNQQKIVLARLVEQRARVWLLDEPTRGIDVGAKHDVHEIVRAHARGGGAVLVASSDLDELFALCDRIAALRRGVLVDVRQASAWSRTDLVASLVAANEHAA